METFNGEDTISWVAHSAVFGLLFRGGYFGGFGDYGRGVGLVVRPSDRFGVAVEAVAKKEVLGELAAEGRMTDAIVADRNMPITGSGCYIPGELLLRRNWAH